MRKHTIELKSEYMQHSVTVGIVTAEKIDKVLLLLHGYGGSFQILDKELPLGEYAEENNMLMILPDMGNGYYIDRPSYRVNDFMMKELLPTVFATYDLRNDMPTYIAGISMGGYGSLLIGATYPKAFKQMIAISPAFIAHDVAIGNPQVVGTAKSPEVMKYYAEIFAPFDTLEEDPLRNPISAVIRSHENGTVPEIIMTCGTKDELYKRNTDAMDVFRGHGVKVDWLSVEEGLHDKECFDKGLRYAFKRLK